MFEKLELEIIRDALCDFDIRDPVRRTNAGALLRYITKLIDESVDSEMIADSTSVALATLDSDVATWSPKDIGNALGDMMGNPDGLSQLSNGERLIGARDAIRSLITQHDDMVARLESLKNHEAILEENRRLRTEIDLLGPADTEQRIAELEKHNCALQSELSVAESKVSGLQQALRSERTTRERTTGQTPHPDVPVVAALPKAKRPCPHRFDHLDCKRCNVDHPNYQAPGQPAGLLDGGEDL